MWLILAWVACASDVRAFAEERAVAICAWHARCETLAEAGFADEATCVAELQHAAAVADRASELGCPSFDPEAADTCLAVWAEASCDTPVDVSVCDEVCGG